MVNINEKEKILLISIITLVCLLTLIIAINLSNNRNTIDKLVSQLEDAINKHNIEYIIELYPDYYKETVGNQLSQIKIDEFHNNVIADNKIQIDIVKISNLDLSDAKTIQDRINQEYHIDIDIQGYQLVTIKYHENFSETTLQVVKINGEYFLYAESYLGEPIQYFTE